jgi:hypothetical protein
MKTILVALLVMLLIMSASAARAQDDNAAPDQASIQDDDNNSSADANLTTNNNVGAMIERSGNDPIESDDPSDVDSSNPDAGDAAPIQSDDSINRDGDAHFFGQRSDGYINR